ncbi:benzoate-CoA ligase family protein [Roseisolibacter sp. H3M3-2]|uniref:benzoate-CoA ligase family protein n=1 Tax=Roseisolibacter sp. H3M3-2 TaxID=3031323 RepID=UPI0023D9F8F6|nr:benzoate-CoA ligase family protein [Roseisolibacter sp. H3M3-2]
MTESAPAARSAHVDPFCRDHLPPRDQWPLLRYDLLPRLDYPDRLNCAVELLDAQVANGLGRRPVFHTAAGTWTYGELLAASNRIAHALVEELGVVPGARVLLRGPNTPLQVACWFAVLKAGAVAVCTMPLLRAREVAYVAEKARVSLALCDARCLDDCAAGFAGREGARTVTFGGDGGEGSLEALMRGKPATFDAVDTAADDVALIAFTSGTTGQGKGTMHFHRDVLAVCDCFPPHLLGLRPDDVCAGTPPIAFTFGLGGLVLFPMRAGASAVLLEQGSPALLLDAVERFRATATFTAPTAYRAMAGLLAGRDVSSLRLCVSAGEALPKATSEAWQAATGLRIVDGIGATEMLHIFISAAGDDVRPGSTGKVVPGYEARVVDDDMAEVPRGTVGRLAVRGPTGCRYLDDAERQRGYVRDGWNLTGDSYVQDADGYFWYQARTDDMIVSSGYNIAGPEVEAALMLHEAVQECAVVGLPDEERGQLVTAYVVCRAGVAADEALAKALQDHVKATIAPYKYPRRVVFVDQLPRTATGKLQRYRLREGDA